MLYRFVILAVLVTAAYGRTPAPLVFIERDDAFLLRLPGWQARFSHAGVHFPGVALEFEGAAEERSIEGTGRLPASVHSLIGREGAGRSRRSAVYSGVRYGGLYPGIDLLYQAQKHELKSEFRLAAGADVASIRLRYQGVRHLELTADGALLGRTDSGEFREQPPYAYQDTPAGRVVIPSAFALLSPDTVGFSVGEYRRDQPLVIDPALSFSTYLGGAMFDAATAVATDAAGNIVVAGWTESADFPANSRQTATGGGVDAFIAKFSPAGQLKFATYLGGRGEDRATGVAVDAAGAIWVTGWTTSSDFPLLSPRQSGLGGGRDAFLVKLDPNGTALQFGTYLGGSLHDVANAVAVDSSGSVYLAGETSSTNFPIMSAFQSQLSGRKDAFAAKFSSTGVLLYSTFIGGWGDDLASGMAVDAAGFAVITGSTDSPNFPVGSAAQPASGGGQDAFVTKLNPAGNAIVFSTFLGGSGGTPTAPESAAGVALNAAGEIYVVGTTTSAGFATSGAFQAAAPGGGVDGFFAKYSPTGSLLFRSYLGGRSVDRVWGVATSGSSVIVVGHTASPDLPVAQPLQAHPAGDYDAFISRFNSSGTQMEFGTWLGGAGSDAALAVAVSPGGAIYVAGQTQSYNFPLVAAVQTANPGNFGAFVAVITPDAAKPQAVSATPSSGGGTSQVFEAVYSHADGFTALASAEVSIRDTGAHTCQVRYVAASNTLELLNDAGVYSGSLVLGGSGSLENSHCAVNAAQSSVSRLGASLALRVSLAFKATYTGDLLIAAMDVSGQTTGWQKYGTWAATAPPPVVPSLLGVSPVSGSGTAQIFEAALNHASGVAAFASAEISIRDSSGHTCQVRYVAASNTLELLNDSGSYGGALVAGGAGSLENSHCVLTASLSSVSKQGTTLTLRTSLSFKTTYTGDLVLAATDVSGHSTGWQKFGTWTALAPPPITPNLVGISPASGSGTAQIFEAVFSHAGGAAALASAEISVKDSAGHTCQVRYGAALNALELLNDAGSYSGPLVPGGAGSLENSHCALSAPQSSVSKQGTTLTFRASLSFKTSYTGDLLIAATDISGHTTGWQKYGAWGALAPPPVTPSVAGISPSSGSGTSQVFTITYSDPQGAQSLVWTHLLIGAGSANACYVRYERAANALYLASDNGSAWGVAMPLGTAGGILQNTQCLLDAEHSSASVAGNNLTVSVSLIFKPTFAGARAVNASADTSAGRSSGLVKVADFQVLAGSNHQPTVVAANPPSGSGSSLTLRVVFEDLNGVADISRTHIMIAGPTGGTCWVVYDRPNDVLYVVDDQGGGAGGSMTPGTNAYISNQQCWIEGMQSYVITTPTLLVVTIQAGFKPSFAGEKTFRALVADMSGWATSWETIGTWTATGSVTMPPAPEAITPAGGEGASQIFTASYSDPNGYQDMGWLHFLVTIGSEKNACYVLYDQRRNMIFLANEAVSEVYGYLTPGVPGVLQNNQCLVDGAGSAVTAAGTTLTLSVALRFKSSFAGLRHIFTAASDMNDWSTGWRYRGSWTVPAGTNQQPAIISLTPNAGTGASASLTAAFSDANGWQDIASSQMLITAAPGAASCYVSYDRAANTLMLMQDNGSVIAGTPGGAGRLENGQCSVNLAASSVQRSGPNLTLTVSLTFKPAFSGQKTIYLSAQDLAGWGTNWQVFGSWRAP